MKSSILDAGRKRKQVWTGNQKTTMLPAQPNVLGVITLTLFHYLPFLAYLI